jgi:bifunctional DNA-binding transcriptional regulator/antitoxin component of YhaV-PrlF toxin-antitoxin module
MEILTTKMTDGYRIVIPSEVRRRLDVQVGATINMEIDDDDTVRLSTPTQAVRRAQALFRKHVPEGRSLVDELIADRRREAEHE